MREHELAVDQPVRADRGREQRRGDGGDRDGHADDGLEVLGRAGAPVVLGLLVQESVPGVGGDARGDAGEGDDQQDAGDVRDQAGGEQGDAGQGDRQREEPAARQRRQHGGRRADADDRAAGEPQHEQPEHHRAAGQVLGVQYGDGDGRRDRPGDGGAGEDEERDGSRASLVDTAAGLGAAQALERRPRARGLRVGQFEEEDDGERGGEQTGRHVGGERGLVQPEPVDPGPDQVPHESDDDERGGRERQRHDTGAQREAPQCVHVVGQRAYGRTFERRGGQQRGRRALARHGPEAFGDAGHEGGDEQDRQRVVRGPVDPQGRDDEERGPHAVRADHRPAPVEGAVLGGQRRERAEEYGSEEQRRQDARAEHGGDGEGHAPVPAPERALGDGCLKGQHHEHKETERVTDAAHELGAPQSFQLRHPQQGADCALPGICDQGVVGGRILGRWLLGSRHSSSLSGPTDSPKVHPNIRPPGHLPRRPYDIHARVHTPVCVLLRRRLP